MSFNPMPLSPEDRKYALQTHARKMLDLIANQSQFDVSPLAKYDYSAQANAANQQAQTNAQTNLVNYLLSDPYQNSLLRRLSGP